MSKSLDERQVALVGKWFPDWGFGHIKAEFAAACYGKDGWHVAVGSESEADWVSGLYPTREEAIAEAEEAALAECPEEEEGDNA